MRNTILVILMSFSVVSQTFSQTSDKRNFQNSLTSESVAKDTTRYGLHGNLLAWITLAPHLEIDVYSHSRWEYSLGGSYGWWGFTGDQHALQTWKVSGEVRRYFKPFTFTGHSLGLRGEVGQIDARLGTYGRRGKLDIVGITYAYTWRLGRNSNWYFDAGLGVGGIYYDYIKYVPYKPTECYHKIESKCGFTFGLTNVGLNFSYRFGGKHKSKR